MDPKGFLPDYQYDIFISYTHLDNASAGQNASGWVDTFHTLFKLNLEPHLGAPVNLMRDSRIKGDDFFDPLCIEQVENSALLITIVSPGYLNSNWCKRELQAFIDKANQASGLNVGHTSRIYKVLKLLSREKS